MDNLTHTLIGALVGETAARLIPAVRSVLPEQTRRALYISVMVIGSNLPDADLLYSGLGGKLGYMLHHRGHTHTVIGALIGAAVMFWVCLGWLRWRRQEASHADRWWLAFVALLAPLLHLLMDGTNNYGVHPFWPLYDGWLYGDTIFIIEPLFWIGCAAPLLLLWRHWAARLLMGTALLLGLGLAFGSGFVPLPLAAALTLLCGGLLWLAHRLRDSRAALCGIAVWLGVLALFASAHRIAGSRIDALAAQEFPNEVMLDRVLTPMPVNPFCWEVVMARTEGDDYTLRIAMMSLSPGFIEATACPTRGLNGASTAPLTTVPIANTPAVAWHGELTMSRNVWRQLASSNCEAGALLQFARMPWYQRNEHGYLVGDLRYDREKELGFSELQLGEVAECSHLPAPWLPPRGDLLGL